MANRIQHLFDERAESLPAGEYFVVAGEFGQLFVTRETACRLRIILARVFLPRWTDVVTLTGSVATIRPQQVQMVLESTADQRAAGRQFWRDREAEENTDRRPWDND
jgi:hypothetical protein